MKIQLNPIKKLQASAMMAVLILAVVVAVTLAAYLVMVKNEYTQVARSQSWNNGLVLAETGVEDAMGLVNQKVGSIGTVTLPVLFTWTATAGGWSQSGSIYTRSNTVDDNIGYYIVTVDNANPTNPVINSTGVAKWVFGGDKSMFGAAGVVSVTATAVPRTVLLTNTYSPVFPGAMTTVVSVDFAGNKVTIDSFNSRNPAHSVWNASLGYGVYPSGSDKASLALQKTIRSANGNVATDGQLINVQNADVYGKVMTGPGGSAPVGSQGSVGSSTWVDGGNNGSQPGYTSDDMNVTFPKVTLPNLGGVVQTLPNSTSVITTSSPLNGYYTINNMGPLTIQGPGTPPAPINVILYLPNGFTYNGGDSLNVGTNATVTIYTGGNISLTGNSTINNLTQDATKLSILALPNVTSITMNGGGSYTGTIYAPSAAFSFGGGGGGNYDFVGSVVSKTASMNGNVNFHYDEALLILGPVRGFVPASWQELVIH